MGSDVAAFLAHSANSLGIEDFLTDHLPAVAGRAKDFAARFGAGELAYWAGLWHDLGKFHQGFQDYLAEGRRSRGPDHSSAGAVYASRFYHPLSFLIAGHHGGLPSTQDLKQRLKRKEGEAAVRESLDRAAEALPGLTPLQAIEGPEWLSRTLDSPRDRRRLEVFMRMLFSCLVDADRLESERHGNPDKSDDRSGVPTLERLRPSFERAHAAMSQNAPATEVNQLRGEIHQHCVEAGPSRQGWFRLTVPTGGGKTLSSMAFALEHARQHQLERVIVAIPFTSIIDQTAKEYRKIFPSGVLEHHSAISVPERENVSTWTDRWPSLAAENWDAPIVVTTTVQLFESLFASHPGKCRKLHNLTGSVVILDEAQTLPFGLLGPSLDVLRELSDHYRVSVVFCTATQPAVAVSPYAELLAEAVEIVPNPERYFERLERVRYEIPARTERWTWGRVAAEMKSAEQVLTVVNTKRDALTLLAELDEDALYMSSNLCPAHRRRILAEVQRRLAGGLSCRLVSTQVVEAGVDLDFPLVLRAVGPLDRIVQAAGRCNREGLLGRRGGRVVIFDPVDGGTPPHWYRRGLEQARQMLHQGHELAQPATYARYFRLLSRTGELDEKGIQALRERLAFPEVAGLYKLIEDDTISVVVPFQGSLEEITTLVQSVPRPRSNPREGLRSLQPYLVSIRRADAERALRAKSAEEIAPGLLMWLGNYDDRLGLLVDEPT